MVPNRDFEWQRPYEDEHSPVMALSARGVCVVQEDLGGVGAPTLPRTGDLWRPPHSRCCEGPGQNAQGTKGQRVQSVPPPQLP